MRTIIIQDNLGFLLKNLLKGDVVGHEFHGNQWTEGESGNIAIANHESLTYAGEQIRANGGAVSTKVTAASYMFSQNRLDLNNSSFYQQGNFVATARLGSLDQMTTAVSKAGFTVQGSRTLADTHQVVFDIPKGGDW